MKKEFPYIPSHCLDVLTCFIFSLSYYFIVHVVTKTFLLLLFRGRPEHLRDERQSDEDHQNHETSDEESEEASVIVQLTNRVQDGTRCRPGSLDMCIQGKCQVSNNLNVNE
jgi:hypothetical protein